MCIIVAKPMNVKMPDRETLRECFLSNPDGAGFMYANGKSVRIMKGFMTFDRFIEALEREIPEAEQDATAVVMHFRIATHGKVQASCCHPFPVTDDKKLMKATIYEGRYGIAHNGVIQHMKTNDDWSDTMDFIARIVAPVMKMNPNWMFDDVALDLIEDLCGSRLAILNNAGELSTVGQFIEDEGVLYSNSSYLKMSWRYNSYSRVWGDRSYYSAYPEYCGYGTDSTDRLDDLLELLPFDYCDDCLWAEECALTAPACNTRKTAREMRDELQAEYDSDMLESERMFGNDETKALEIAKG